MKRKSPSGIAEVIWPESLCSRASCFTAYGRAASYQQGVIGECDDWLIIATRQKIGARLFDGHRNVLSAVVGDQDYDPIKGRDVMRRSMNDIAVEEQSRPARPLRRDDPVFAGEPRHRRLIDRIFYLGS